MTIWPDMKRATAPGPERAEPVEAPRDLPAAASAPVPPVDPARSGAPPAEAGRLDIATPGAEGTGAPRPSRLRRRLGLVAAIVLSAAAHAALIGYLLEHLRPEGIEAATDSVSVELLFETELATIEPSASAPGEIAAQPETPAELALEDPNAESAVATPVEAESSDEAENGIETPPVEPDPALAVAPEPAPPSAEPSLQPIEPETAETLPEVAPEFADEITEPEIAEETLAAEIEHAEPLGRVEPETLAPAPVEPAHPPIAAPAPEPIAPVEAAEPDAADAPTVVEPATPVETSAAEPTPPEASAEATSPPVEPDRAPTISPDAEMSGSSAAVPALPETAPPPVESPLEQEAVAVEPDLHLPDRMALLPSARPAPPAARADRATAPARPQRASPRETREPARTPPQRRQSASPPATSPRAAAPAARETRRPAASAPAAAPSRAASAGEQAQYARRLARHVERYKRYPAAAARQRITGVARIAITINRSGGLVAARVTAGAGHSVLDEEALAIARRAAPYPRPPDGIADGNFSFTVALRFAR